MGHLKILAPAHKLQSVGIAPVSLYFYHLDQHVLLPSQLTGEGGWITNFLPCAWAKNSIFITIQRCPSDAAHLHCPEPGVCLTLVSINVTQREDLTLGTWRISTARSSGSSSPCQHQKHHFAFSPPGARSQPPSLLYPPPPQSAAPTTSQHRKGWKEQCYLLHNTICHSPWNQSIKSDM